MESALLLAYMSLMAPQVPTWEYTCSNEMQETVELTLVEKTREIRVSYEVNGEAQGFLVENANLKGKKYKDYVKYDMSHTEALISPEIQQKAPSGSVQIRNPENPAQGSWFNCIKN